MDALSDALGQLDPGVIKEQVTRYVPADVQKILAASGIRDEHVFPLPLVLELKPTLVGYYRLLLGVSQKRFYRAGTEMGPFKSMEERGVSDPDIRIQEEFEKGRFHNKVAIEIKGGTDHSNAHNRAGEAEKSHQKAKNLGYRDCWTIISMTGVNREKLHEGSPTTSSWFEVAEVLARDGADWREFLSRFADATGIPIR
jgi:hypothetical protein